MFKYQVVQLLAKFPKNKYINICTISLDVHYSNENLIRHSIDMHYKCTFPLRFSIFSFINTISSTYKVESNNILPLLKWDQTYITGARIHLCLWCCLLKL